MYFSCLGFLVSFFRSEVFEKNTRNANKKKWTNFGWDCEEVDGHDLPKIYDALMRQRVSKRPVAIIANTVKGKGVSFTEDDNAWHHSVLTKKMYDLAISELG